MSDQEIKFTLNDREMTARKGETILAAALRAGVHIPHFCYHKYLSVVGQCRACLVEVLDAGGGNPIPKLQTSCSMPPAEGMVVSSLTPRVDAAQEGVFEFLLKNHPLDCPVCDQGGECPLQDQTMAYGKAISRTHEKRRIYPEKEISAYIQPEMNRCVHCTRCIRYTQEIDGGGEFGWAHRGDRTEVGIFESLPLTSIVSGNVIDICPVGALTDNKYRFTARVWEMNKVEGPCTLCSVGCRQQVWTMDGMVKRVTAGENERVNDSWICDVGRFGWSANHAPARITQPMIRREGALQPVGWAEAYAEAAARLLKVKEEGGGAIAALGGAGATNEAAFQFGAFVRTVLGSPHVDCRLHPRDAAQSEAQRAALGGFGGHGGIENIGKAKAVLLIGADPFEEHPILALQARKAHGGGAVLISLHPRRIDLRVQGRMIHLNPLPGEEMRALRALAGTLIGAGAAPDGEGAKAYQKAVKGADTAALCREADMDPESIAEAARALRPEGGGVVVVVGPGVQDPATAAEAVNLSLLLGADLLFAASGANLQGALDMGLHPEGLPPAACAAVWRRDLPQEKGLPAAEILDGLAEKKLRAIYLLGCDPITEAADAGAARRALEAAGLVILHAAHTCASMEYADIVLPAPSLYEEEGTITNLERRVQTLRRALRPALDRLLPETWKVFGEIARAMGHPMRAGSLDQIKVQMRELVPDYAGAVGRLPESGVHLRREAKKVYQSAALPPASAAGGGLRLVLAPTLWLSGAAVSAAFHLSDMPGAALRLAPPDAEAAGLVHGEVAEFEMGGEIFRLPVRVDVSLPAGLAWAPEGALRALGGGALDPAAGGARGVEIRVRAAAAVGAEA
ncbi:MAG: NADH-quinone oxidoreductase subunit NuoG [bacterium]|nr:NADH-quinone oxidoreductase subunit NuoG [bacterium]